MTSPDIQAMIQTVEVRVMDCWNFQSTLRNLTETAKYLGFSRRQLIQYLRGRDILDTGSGLNGLAIDAFLHRINTRIYSLSPGSGQAEFEQIQKLQMQFHWNEYYSGYTPEQVEAARIKAGQNSIAGFAHKIELPDSSVDAIVDSAAVFHYARREEQPVLELSLQEMVRVLRPGGRIRIGDIKLRAPSPEYWMLQFLYSRGINFTTHANGIEIFTG